MNETTQTHSLKGTWNQAILTFLLPIFLVLGVRWSLVEPFVIPSGSMIPNLLIHDHILVKKFSYGLHVPFGNQWLLRWREPQRGEIVVFKYPENPDVYYIKRLIGLPGDRVEVNSGRISVNGKVWDLKPYSAADNENGFSYFTENNGEFSYVVRFMEGTESSELQTYTIPEGQYFFMGDNRDQSSDSRFWGFVKEDYIVGRAWLIWMSCENTLSTMTLVCDPAQIRFKRIFQKLH